MRPACKALPFIIIDIRILKVSYKSDVYLQQNININIKPSKFKMMKSNKCLWTVSKIRSKIIIFKKHKSIDMIILNAN